MKYNYSLILAALMSVNISAKMVEYVEDAYLVQAPQELVARADKAAELAGFDKNYEIVIAKKAGIQVNPWNGFVSLSNNPQTQNPVIIVNPAWFNNLSEEQQLFFLVRCFLTAQKGLLPTSVKVLPFLFLALSILLIVLFFVLLGKSRFAHLNKWIRILIACGLMSVLNLTIVNRVAQKLNVYLAGQQDMHIITTTIEKTGNKQAAIAALEAIDASIKKEIAEGETFWKPVATTFENFANELKK